MSAPARSSFDPRVHVEIARLHCLLMPSETRRWFTDQPLMDQDNERTYVISKMWGRDTEPTLSSLVDAFPQAGVTFQRVEIADEESQ